MQMRHLLFVNSLGVMAGARIQICISKSLTQPIPSRQYVFVETREPVCMLFDQVVSIRALCGLRRNVQRRVPPDIIVEVRREIL
jgi:hypothetical protein